MNCVRIMKSADHSSIYKTAHQRDRQKMELPDFDSLIQPLSDDEPCGPDLEYDAVFGEMERASQGTSEQQYGDTIVEAEGANWKEVKKCADDLLTRTRDMRVAVYWGRATLNLEGLDGFEFSMRLLRHYVESFWPTLHPELDAEDNDDPTYRTNTLIMLCDEGGLLKELGNAPLVASRAVGRFSMADVHRAEHAAEHSSSSKPDEESWDTGGTEEKSSVPGLDTIEAAFTDVEIETIQATEELVSQTLEHVTEIESNVTTNVSLNFAVSLAPVRNLLKEMQEFVNRQLERRGVFAVAESDEPAEQAAGDESPSVQQGGTVATPAAGMQLGRINTRQDAIKALDAVCDFYESNEPSSPLPLLIRRAQRLASKSFLDILRDLAPDAVSQAELLGGGIAASSSESSPAPQEEEASDGW